jgi:hypothetical protein
MKALWLRAFFKDFSMGGEAFFEKGPFCKIIY